ncbi:MULTISPECIES: hypothetical protein [Paenibacillus]|uniref:hypothetical protein n=1 Tax=Paenibacillus TaxID=44249 RepID=UPI0022B90BAE|nr:hypothetical protein [Paenibacillus caseinilyticus]MCZ8518625.1 hypothetical protein [Paenibacillus caseinilyticus]
MSGESSGWKRAWMDDYLDLYNFAKACGDEAWQADILGTLRSHRGHIRREEQAALRESLWRQFDALNMRLLELHVQLREPVPAEQRAVLQRRIRELKVERIRLTNRICSSRREAGVKDARRKG